MTIDFVDDAEEEVSHAIFRQRTRSALNAIRWRRTTPEQLDFMNYYQRRASRRGMRTPVNVMPPSPGSKSVRYSAMYDYDEDQNVILKWSATHELRPETIDLIKSGDMSYNQINHRGRVGTLASSLLQVNEWNRRKQKTQEAADSLPEAQLSESKSIELRDAFVDITLKHLTYDVERIRKYIHEHANSSAIPGFKWGAAPPPEDEIYKEIFNWTKDFLERWRSGELDGMLLDSPFNSGMRARNKTSYGNRKPVPRMSWLGTDDRTRTVNFLIGFSTVTMFIVDKSRYYDECLQAGERIIRPDLGGGRSISPLVQGGEVYSIVADHLSSGDSEPIVVELGDDRNLIMNGKIHPYDMNACEAITGWTLGRAFWPVLTTAGGFAQLASGIWATSILDMYTTKAFAAQLGFNRGNDLTLEWQEEDYQAQFLLGLSYAKDPQMPTFQGLKLSGDSADKGQNMPIGGTLELKGKHDQGTIDRWVDAYRGVTPDGDSLLSTVRRIASGKDYFDPSALVEERVL